MNLLRRNNCRGTDGLNLRDQVIVVCRRSRILQFQLFFRQICKGRICGERLFRVLGQFSVCVEQGLRKFCSGGVCVIGRDLDISKRASHIVCAVGGPILCIFKLPCTVRRFFAGTPIFPRSVCKLYKALRKSGVCAVDISEFISQFCGFLNRQPGIICNELNRVSGGQ